MTTATSRETIADRFLILDEIKQSDRAQLHHARNLQTGSRIAIKTDKARVFRAEDTTTGQQVAVKILQPWVDRQLATRFEREVEFLASFSHPNVVRCLGTGHTEGGRPYLAMELLQGQTLGDIVAQDGPVQPEELSEYLTQAASALDAAHKQGIIHRDINPYNIMLSERPGGRTVVKLLDFGLAKALEQANPKAGELTGAGTTLGTAAYMSPEQARGNPVDARSDVYSLGATLYEALTGELPYAGRSEIQTILAHANQPVPDFPAGWWENPRAAGVEAVVKAALAKSPEDRPQSAGELASRFRDAVAGRSAGTRGSSKDSSRGASKMVAPLAAVALVATLAVAYFIR